MSQSVLLKARGLFTYPNNLSEVPEGALTVADNVVIDRNGVVEPRRGFAQYSEDFGIGTDRAKQLLVYKNRLLLHYSNILAFDDGTGAWTNFNGSYSETQSGLRIKSVEANGNLYFTSSTGVKRISATSASQFTGSAGYIRNAGAPEALDIIGTVDYTTAGFLTDKSKVAYRLTWAFYDANGNLIEGAPSSRFVLTNYSNVDSGTASLEFAIPSDIGTSDTQFFYRLYRTQVVQAATVPDLDNIDPGDEMNLVIEDYPTSGELTARLVQLDDVTPEDFRAGGALLYTNPVSGEGILQSNTPPPFCNDIALFQNTVFYANTATNQQLNLALLSVSQLTTGVSTITITQGMTSNTYTFVGVKEVTDITTVADVAGSLNNTYFYLNSASDERQYYVWFNVSGGGTDPLISGRLGIEVTINTNDSANAVAIALEAAIGAITTDFTTSILANVVTVTNADNGNTTDATDAGLTGFTITVTTQGDGEDQALRHVLLSANVSPAQSIDETARSLVNIINNNSSEVVNAFYLSGPDDVPGLILLKTRSLTGVAFSLTANSTATGSQFNPTLPTTGTSVISSNEVEPNALFYSKFQQPEAVPIVNKFNVGPKDKSILRILPLRDSLFVLKEDGIYRVTGQAGGFNLDPFDTSAILTAPDSAVVLNNQIYMLSSQGIVRVSDTGVDVISRPIEGILDRITSANFNFASNTFGVSYESDRAYLIWTVSNPNDTRPTQCFRFNTFTTSWTRFPISKTCGIVKFDDDLLYLGPGDENFIEQERKNFDRTDFADREYPLQIPQNAADGRILTLSSTADVEIGDVLLQTQNLSIYQFNQLLKKLDLDPGVSDSDYYDTLQAPVGADLRDLIDQLAQKLDADPGVNNTNFFSSLTGGPTFADFQIDFNIIVGLLNTDSGVSHTNYPTSSGTITFEALVVSKIKNSSNVELKFSAPFIEGPVTLSRGIKSNVIWAPQTFGDPSLLKQVREGTTLFEDTVFYAATMSYASDLSPDFEEIDFNGSGIGDWGAFVWNEQNWGGGGSQVPLRTYIPRDKQRCRFIRPRFEHLISREKFSLFGLSLTFRVIGPRAYRS